MKLPAFQFYPGDWMKDPAVRSVSLAARGLWMDMLCLMHESARRGYLQHASGKPYTPDQLARQTGCSVDEASRLLQELEDSEVFSRSEHGVIYCRRMVRDERKRSKCSEAGKKGGNPTLKGESKGDSKGDSKPDPTPSSSSSSSASAAAGSCALGGPGGPEAEELAERVFDALVLAGVGEPKRGELVDLWSGIPDAPQLIRQITFEANRSEHAGTGLRVLKLEQGATEAHGRARRTERARKEAAAKKEADRKALEELESEVRRRDSIISDLDPETLAGLVQQVLEQASESERARWRGIDPLTNRTVRSRICHLREHAGSETRNDS